eukprot:7390214-Prymnesium_polylepis.3
MAAVVAAAAAARAIARAVGLGPRAGVAALLRCAAPGAGRGPPHCARRISRTLAHATSRTWHRARGIAHAVSRRFIPTPGTSLRSRCAPPRAPPRAEVPPGGAPQ